MPAPPPDPSDPAPGFDPNRHRKEIELMEKRFRERSERHGGGPVSTGEIDSRVADEMRQFFDASAQQLETVVPQLQTDERALQMAETTGEIRKKIDDFFAQVKDSGDLSPSSQQLAQTKSKWVGMFPGGESEAAPPAQSRGRPLPPVPPPPPAPAVSRATSAVPARPSPTATGRAMPLPAEEPVASSEPVADGAKMDLKTALEKLRRHGTMKEEGGPPAPAPRRPAPPPAAPRPVRETAPQPAAPRPEPVARTPRPDDGERLPPIDPAPQAEDSQALTPGAPRADQSQRLPRREVTGAHRVPEPVVPSAPSREPAPTRGGAQALPPVPPASARRETVTSRATPPQPAPVVPTATAETSAPVPVPVPVLPVPVAPRPALSRRPPPTMELPAGARPQFVGRSYAAASGQRASSPAARLTHPDKAGGPVVDRPRQPRLHPAAPDEASAPRVAPTESHSVPVAPPVPAPVPAAAPPAAPRQAAPPKDPPSPTKDSIESFDSIFREVEGIVLDTLKVSVDETFEAARETEVELSEVAMPTLRESESEAISESVSEAVGRLYADQAENGDMDAAEAPAPAAPPPARAVPAAAVPATARATRLSRPAEDEEADEVDEPAPEAPYDWGVKAAPKPKGAWLLDTPDELADAKPVTSEVHAPPSAPAASGSGGGARGYLVRKANEEVRKFEPVLKALKSANMLNTQEIAGPKSGPVGGDDEFVSAESFKDNRPTPEELDAELSPMRLVEELRRLKRVTQALMAKGVITADDLNKSQGD